MIYNGLTVLTEDPNRRESPSHAANRSKVRIDSVTGPFTEVEKGKAQRQSRPFSWFMESRAAIDAFRAFRAERMGRLVPFWIPTWHHDLVLALDAPGNSGHIEVEAIGYSQHQFDATTTWRRHLALIQLGVGINQIRRVDGVLDLSLTEILTLDANTNVQMNVGYWMLSFLTLCRLDTDSVTMHWHGQTTAEATFNVIELPQEMPLVPV